MNVLRAIGLMSGTSLDGIDVALIETDGEAVIEVGPAAFRPYDEREAMLLRRALQDAQSIAQRCERPGALAEAEAMVTAMHEEAVRTFLQENRIDAAAVDLIGFHGQTVLHRPHERLTVQLGDGVTLARRLSVPVVYDFRAADVAAGGQGAPLVPVYHRALAHKLDRPQPLAVLNIGGVANVTYIDRDDIRAGDTGPGNALIDDFMASRTGRRMDEDGAAAAAGSIIDEILRRLIAHPFFCKPLPKSLDRNQFASLAAAEAARLSTQDGAATLTAFTAVSIASSIELLPKPPRTWLIAGGGAHNRTLMRLLRQRLAPAIVETAEAVGWSADALEAQAFAYLAVRSIRGLPITFPLTTGVPQPIAGGALARPVPNRNLPK